VRTDTPLQNSIRSGHGVELEVNADRRSARPLNSLTCVIVNSRREALHQGTPEVHKGSPLGQNPCSDWALERERQQETEQNLKDQGQTSGL